MEPSPVVAKQTSVVTEDLPVVAGSGIDPDVAASSAVAEPHYPWWDERIKEWVGGTPDEPLTAEQQWLQDQNDFARRQRHHRHRDSKWARNNDWHRHKYDGDPFPSASSRHRGKYDDEHCKANVSAKGYQPPDEFSEWARNYDSHHRPRRRCHGDQ